MIEKIVLDERLSAAAELVPQSAVLLDVGTDHGYLPAKLLLDGKIARAGASDVNEDPLSKAVKTAEKYGVSDKMSFYLSDGLASVPDLNEYTAVSICGMGGELIARIISDSEYLRERRVPLVLQPMSSAEDLSEYLAENGYAVTDERIAFAAGKVYRVMLAAYDGRRRELTPIEHLIGRINIDRGTTQKNFGLLLNKNILKYKRMIDGKAMGGIECPDERKLFAELCSIAAAEGIKIENI